MESVPEGALEQVATDSSSIGQIRPNTYTCLAMKHAIIFTFLKVVKTKQNKRICEQRQYVASKI